VPQASKVEAEGDSAAQSRKRKTSEPRTKAAKRTTGTQARIELAAPANGVNGYAAFLLHSTQG
jgi:hypothetical protein